MSLETYSEYKQIDHPWLELIPTHWTAKRFKFMAAIKNGRDHKHIEVETGGYPVIGSGGQFGYASAFLYDGESVLLGRKGTVNKPLYVSNPFWTVDTMFYTVIGSRFHVKFLYYCSLTIPFDRYLTSTALPSMTQEGLGNIAFAVPPLKEQQAIATFLDHETARIDTLIEKQQKLIALLKEKRQALISHAVTKGLDPTAPMKESGVEWLGEVPEHWDIAALKLLSKLLQTGPFGSQLHSEDYVSHGIPLINPSHIIEEKLIPDPDQTVSEITAERLSRHKLKAGDIICARRGELGRCAVILSQHQGWLCGTGSLKVSLGRRLNSTYTQKLISSNGIKFELSLSSKGSTMDNLNTEILGDIRLPVPPIKEQIEIINYLHIIQNKLNGLEELCNRQITLLQERRTVLISAAVTGKIDVRNHPSARATA